MSPSAPFFLQLVLSTCRHTPQHLSISIIEPRRTVAQKYTQVRPQNKSKKSQQQKFGGKKKYSGVARWAVKWNFRFRSDRLEGIKSAWGVRGPTKKKRKKGANSNRRADSCQKLLRRELEWKSKFHLLCEVREPLRNISIYRLYAVLGSRAIFSLWEKREAVGLIWILGIHPCAISNRGKRFIWLDWLARWKGHWWL